jgi:hypothetical protein
MYFEESTSSMATLKPRITISLDPEVYEVYRQVAIAQGRPMSKLMCDQLDFMVPTLQKILKLQKRMEETTEKNREIFVKAGDKAEEHMNSLWGLFEGLFDAIEEASPPEGPRRGAGGAKSQERANDGLSLHDCDLVEVDGQHAKKPPSSNTGVTI